MNTDDKWGTPHATGWLKPNSIDEAWDKPEEIFERRVWDEASRIAKLLISKNKAYGNAALDPVRVFSGASPKEQLLVRIDDKLSRISRGSEFPGDDTIDDLIGYLFLLKLA